VLQKAYSKELETSMHKTIKKVTEDYEKMKFNTAIASLMSILNEFYEKSKVTIAEFKTFILLLNPVAPHITEELWQLAGLPGALHENKWPVWEEDKTIDDFIDIAVQIKGKVKAIVKLPADCSKIKAREIVMDNANIKKLIDGKNIIKEIYVPNKIYNIVI